MIEGVVRGGVVILDAPAALADGTRVTVVPTAPLNGNAMPAIGSTAQILLKYVGVGDTLPEDMARNHDHYLHGRDKR